jgi:Fe2+ transport system protein FeoA
MTCCPACGYSWVEPEQSRVGRLLRGWFRGAGWDGGQRSRSAPGTLAEVPPGWKARLLSWDTTPARRRQQLRAYGLTESSWIHVVQHVPTTIIRVEQTELALERELADTILVEAAQPAHAQGG